MNYTRILFFQLDILLKKKPRFKKCLFCGRTFIVWSVVMSSLMLLSDSLPSTGDISTLVIQSVTSIINVWTDINWPFPTIFIFSGWLNATGLYDFFFKFLTPNAKQQLSGMIPLVLPNWWWQFYYTCFYPLATNQLIPNLYLKSHDTIFQKWIKTCSLIQWEFG